MKCLRRHGLERRRGECWPLARDAGGNLSVDQDRVTAATSDRLVLALGEVLADLTFRFAGDLGERGERQSDLSGWDFWHQTVLLGRRTGAPAQSAITGRDL